MENEKSETMNEQWRQDIIDLAEKISAAAKDGDADALMDCFWNSPDLIMVNSNGTITRGWDNMKAEFEQFVDSTEWRELSGESISTFQHGDAFYTVGICKWKFQLKDGPLVEFREVWTDTAKKIDGKLVYIVNHPHDLTPFTK